MHLILTHEQADFDALASLLAARILEPDSRAVLPHRANRNVRAFLTLYGEELPLDSLEDLPRDGVCVSYRSGTNRSYPFLGATCTICPRTPFCVAALPFVIVMNNARGG